jgi:hypothetical protein
MKPSLSLRVLNAYINDCKQIDHCFGLLHDVLLNSLYYIDVLDVRDSISGVAETFHVIPEALIKL